MSVQTIVGEFWTAADAARRISGRFNAQLGEKVEAELEDRLVQPLDSTDMPVPRPAPQPYDVAAAVRAHAAGAIARFWAITFLGQLETGELVSVFDANEYPGSRSVRYVAPIAVLGAHVTFDQPYSAVRFRLDHPFRLSHLADKEASVVADDQSTLSVEAADGANWLMYTPANPATLTQLEIRAISSCLVLAQLALFPDAEPEFELHILDTQVTIDPGGKWLSVRGPAFCHREPESLRVETLLPHGELTVERFAKWIELNDKFDGLAWAVARPINVPIQLQVQLLTSLVEGFHRRLTTEEAQTWFPDTKREIRLVREAATQAAVDKAHQEGLDHELVGTRVWNALGHFTEKSFLERAEEIIDEVCATVPEIRVGATTLPSRLTEPRHSFAHQLRPRGSLEDRIERWIVVWRVAPWLLRVLVLLKVGVEPQVVHQRCLENETFAFHREQSEIRVKKLGWDRPATPQKPRTWAPSTPAESHPLTALELARELMRTIRSFWAP